MALRGIYQQVGKASLNKLYINKYRAIRKTKLKEIYLVRYADDAKIFCRDYQTAQKMYHATVQSGNIDNVVPQGSNINRAGGKWYKMEKRWVSALEKGKSVNITPIYEGTSARPSSFQIQYSITKEISGNIVENRVFSQKINNL